MKRKDAALHDTLLNLARSIVDEEGIEAVSIRALAQKAGVATGTIYNYFTGKDEILLALTQAYWEQTLLDMQTVITASSFCGKLQEIYIFLRERIDHCAGKLMSSLNNAETAGIVRMGSMHSLLETILVRHMEQDINIRSDIWNETFTREQFAHFIMTNLIMLLKTDAPNPDFLIELIRRTIY